MSNKKQFVDIHCHPTMKPFYSSIKHAEKKNIWEFIKESPACDEIKKSAYGPLEKFFVKELESMAKDSQMNLDSCIKGNLALLFVSLYPVERSWFKIRKLMDIATHNEFITNSSICSSGFHEKIIGEIERVIDRNEEINYFDELVREYYFLNSSQARSDSHAKQFFLVNSYEELKPILSNPIGEKIALILNVEGGHSLSRFDNFEELRNIPFRKVNRKSRGEYKKHKARILKNIAILKGKESIDIQVDEQVEIVHFKHTPFYITFAHHFWNLLCGHADSFGIGADLALNQSRGKNRRFTALGRLVLKELLYRSPNERRILIDIKHLSIPARKEFYKIWKYEYEEKGDGFPIIFSHTAVNGRELYRAAATSFDDLEDSVFNTSSINMYDHDIKMVHKSGGLIGIMLSKSRLPGQKALENIKHHLKQIKKHPEKKEELEEENRLEYMKSLTANVFHIIRVVEQKSAWDIVSIGSDFDGMINPLESYKKAEDFGKLSSDLQEYIEKCQGIEEMNMSPQEMKELMKTYTAQQIVEKIMGKNAIGFTRKYFHDDFLKNGKKHSL